MKQLDRMDQGIETLLVITQHIQHAVAQQCATCRHSPATQTVTPSDSDEPSGHPLMTAKEVQTRFGIVHSTYYRWIAKGWLVPQVIGGKHYYESAEIKRKFEGRKYRQRGGMEP